MPGRLTFKIEGAGQLESVLKKLPAEVAAKVSEGAVRAAAALVRDEAIARAPIRSQPGVKYDRKGKSGRARLPGHLKRSIRVKKVRRSGKSVHYVVTVGRAFYGMFSEFGTSRQAARPWFRPALDASASRALDRLGLYLGKGIEREAEKLAGRHRTRRRRSGGVRTNFSAINATGRNY